MKKKLIILDGSMDVTGAFKSSLYTAESLSDRFIIIYIIPSNSNVSSILKSKGYDFYQLPLFSLSKNIKSIMLYLPLFIYCSFKIKNICSENECSVIIHNDYDKPYSFFTKLMGWKGRVFTFIRRRPNTLNKYISYIWLKLSEMSSEKLIAVSDIVLKEAINFKISKVVKIYNCIRVEASSPNYNYPNYNIICFLYLSNYMPGKGQKEALLAFKRVNEKYRNCRLYFVGGDLGLEKNRNFKSKLMLEAQNLNLSDSVVFKDFKENIEEVFNESHVALSFSKAESFSRICVESACFGRPIIATKCGGPEEIIQHNKTGFLVSIDDIEAMSMFMEWFILNPEQISIMGKNANTVVNKKFSFEIFKEKLDVII